MKDSAWQQYCILLRHSLKLEIADAKKILTSLLFGVSILFLFSFAMGEPPPEIKVQVIIAEVFIANFLVLQLIHQQMLKTEEADRAFDILTISPISYSMLFFSKVCVSTLISMGILLPFITFIQFLEAVELWNLFFMGILALSSFALSTVGTLLAQMTGSSEGKQMIYPLLYFPLSMPVLLSSVQASFAYWGIHSSDSMGTWFEILILFSVIYFVLGILLFEEILGVD